MASVTTEEAQAKLPYLIHRMFPGEGLVITENENPVERLVPEPARTNKTFRTGPGVLKGMVTHMAPDFDEQWEHLQDYIDRPAGR